jgi:hypothetical protein
VTAHTYAVCLTAYLIAVVAVITLAPFRIDPSRAASVQWIVRDGWMADATLNVVLFVPLGFAWQRGTRRPVLHVVVLLAYATVAYYVALLLTRRRLLK